MISKSGYYIFNLGFGLLLFLLTISCRNDLAYTWFEDVKAVGLYIEVWNWVMLLSLLFTAVFSARLARQYAGIYAFYFGFSIILLVLTAFAMFIMPAGIM